jgi:glyoxylase-like metal-dependent hydrolase (beta-lactamase superfamily II)
MTTLNRRNLLTGAAAIGAATFAPTTPSTAQTSTPPSGLQAPGWYRYKVGDIEVTVATDGVNRFRFPDGFVANQPRDQVNAALAAAYLQPAPDMIAIPYCPCAVNTGSRLVVIDTGTGEANFKNSKGAAGQFQTNLKAAGIDRNQVDVVIISHIHGDHINGLLTPDGKPAFPKAEIMVPAPEWKFFTDDGEMSRQSTDRMKGVFAGFRRVFDALGRKVTQYEAGKEIVPGITAVATHGHTPGHMSHIVSSGKSKVYIQADVTNLPIFVRNPGWHLMFDQDAKMAEETRRKVYDMLVAERMMVQGFHYPFPGLAYIEKAGNGYREIPVPWSPVL